MSIPPRVGGALVVLGQANGEQERYPAHVLSPPVYGAGNHEYFPSYPVTTPSNVITKVWGLLGATTGSDVTVTPSTLPRNFLTITCYKTELNHRYPRYAYDNLGQTDSYDSSAALSSTAPYPLILDDPSASTDEKRLLEDYVTTFMTHVEGSFVTATDVTDILEDPTSYTGDLRTLFPRWTDEAEWDMGVQPYEDAIQVTPTSGDPYWQTRDGITSTPPDDQNAVDFISPWYVSIDPDDSVMKSLTRKFCDFSYKFTATGTTLDGDGNLIPEYCITDPWNEPSVYPTNLLPDTASWQYSRDEGGSTYYKYPSGCYRSVLCFDVVPKKEDGSRDYCSYQSTATHGLFLDSRGSCWNLGTVLEVTVHIWKAPPKRCFFPNNVNSTPTNGQSNSFTNWKVGYPSHPSGIDGGYHADKTPITRLTGPAYGHPGNRHDSLHPGLQYFQTGHPTQIDYTIAEPNAVNLHYWGCVFAPDYDSERCVEHEALNFTVTIDETNTYACDGTDRPGVTYTAYGVKLEDIVLPSLEGYIVYIKDYEVTAITKAGEV